MPEIVEMHNRLQINLFFMDYRGYGNSAGYPSEPGLAMDAAAALDYVASRRDVDVSRIFIFGSSLGGAVAIRLAYTHQHRVRL
jgi:fermentation-respiration switch protein FrsA (DUF1100 family)